MYIFKYRLLLNRQIMLNFDKILKEVRGGKVGFRVYLTIALNLNMSHVLKVSDGQVSIS